MTKREIVKSISSKIKIPETLVKKCLEQFYQELYNALDKGETIELRGLGTFSMKTQKGRSAQNFKTGERYKSEDKNVVSFKPGKKLLSLNKTIEEGGKGNE